MDTEEEIDKVIFYRTYWYDQTIDWNINSFLLNSFLLSKKLGILAYSVLHEYKIVYLSFLHLGWSWYPLLKILIIIYYPPKSIYNTHREHNGLTVFLSLQFAVNVVLMTHIIPHCQHFKSTMQCWRLNHHVAGIHLESKSNRSLKTERIFYYIYIYRI